MLCDWSILCIINLYMKNDVRKEAENTAKLSYDSFDFNG